MEDDQTVLQNAYELAMADSDAAKAGLAASGYADDERKQHIYENGRPRDRPFG